MAQNIPTDILGTKAKIGKDNSLDGQSSVTEPWKRRGGQRYYKASKPKRKNLKGKEQILGQQKSLIPTIPSTY